MRRSASYCHSDWCTSHRTLTGPGHIHHCPHTCRRRSWILAGTASERCTENAGEAADGLVGAWVTSSSCSFTNLIVAISAVLVAILRIDASPCTALQESAWASDAAPLDTLLVAFALDVSQLILRQRRFQID